MTPFLFYVHVFVCVLKLLKERKKVSVCVNKQKDDETTRVAQTKKTKKTKKKNENTRT